MSDDLIANTVYGKLRGTLASNGCITFKGVPYGADTSGENRFLPPRKPESWSGVRDATDYADNCLQIRIPRRQLFSSWIDSPTDSENCLSLNIWTPALDGKKRPILFWLHGGGYIVGSGNSTGYDGYRLAKNQDVVVVTINHRLSIFGYLYLAEIGGAKYANTGNQGQLDMVAALEWVRDNIENFGGDPDNVTIFGESSGGGKVCGLMAMVPGKGLFKRAICQSGPLITGMTKEEATSRALYVLRELGLADDDIDGLHKVSGQQMLMVSGKAMEKFGFGGAFYPVVNGTDMPASPFSPEASPVCRDVDFLVGCTKDEGTVLGSLDATLFDPMKWEDVPRRVSALTGADPLPAIAAFRKLYPEANANDIFFAIASQLIMRFNSGEIADMKARQKGGKVYSYLLTWPSPAEGGKWRCTHTVDVPLVFDNITNAESIVGTPEQNQIQPLADIMSAAWAQFARTGDPNVPGLPHWPAYDDKQRYTMVFDRQSEAVADPAGAERAAMGDLLTKRIFI